MRNVVRFNTQRLPNSIKSGDFNIGVDNDSIDLTGFYNGITPIIGGYTIYINKTSNGPSIYTPKNDNELIQITNSLGADVSTATNALTWINSQSNMTVVNTNYPPIVTDGLVLNIDAGLVSSYPKTGTTWRDLSGGGNDSTTVGTTYNEKGYITFPGTGERDSAPVGEYITLNTSITTTSPSDKPNGVTYNVWMRFTGNQPTGHGIFFGSTTINHIEFRGSNVTSGYWRTEAVTQNGYSFGGGGTNADGGHVLNEWFNLTLVFANNETNRPVRWYRDGVLFHTGNMTSGSNPSGEYFRPNSFGKSTGTDRYKYVESFKGDMSNLQIYNRSLTQQEITQNYYAGLQRFIPTDGLVLSLDAQNTNLYATSPTTAYDISGEGNDGTMLNGVQYVGDGGGSWKFDGVNDFIEISRPSISFSPNRWTICVWMKPNNQHSRFITPSSNGIDQFLSYDNINQRVNITIASSADVNGRTRRGTTGSIPINEWSFSCVSVDNLNIKIYANSTLTNEYNETLSIGNWGGSWIVGQRGNSTFWYLGLLSEIKIHNRALTQDEITTMYNATKSRYGIQ